MGEALFLTLWDKAATILSRRLNSKHQRSEEHTSELQSQSNLVCRLLLEKKKNYKHTPSDYAPAIAATRWRTAAVDRPWSRTSAIIMLLVRADASLRVVDTALASDIHTVR